VDEINAAIKTATAEEDIDATLAYLVQTGTQIIDGAEFDGSEADSWIVYDWLSKLNSF